MQTWPWQILRHVINSFCKQMIHSVFFSWMLFKKCLVVTPKNPYGENCHFFFCINFDKVINLVVKVNLLDKKVLCIGWVTYQATFHSLNEINWTYTFWDMIKFIRRGLTFLEGFIIITDLIWIFSLWFKLRYADKNR